MSKSIRLLFVCLILTLLLSACAERQARHGAVWQTATISTLMVGAYDGEVTIRDLKEHGDLGLGIFNAADGEMIQLDGRVYQIKSDGVAYPVGDDLKTPFAVTTFFSPCPPRELNQEMNIKQLEQYLDDLLPTKNLIYAFKIEGTFKYLKTRSIPRQSRPYPKLTEVVKHQSVFEFHDVTGTIVAFRFPEYNDGVNLPQNHCHFLTADKKAGGHVLDGLTTQATVRVHKANDFFMSLPDGGDFYRVDPNQIKKNDLNQVER
ncbi:MAG: acetolactate decarboxylase [Deltaproteobacteria bacterium]|nr:acetolactate decarboxylase [Deltaproteobacteria bacterium]